MILEDTAFRLAPPSPGNVIEFPRVRITLLSSRLVRFEWSADGKFEDHQTLAVINRDLGNVSFQKSEVAGKVVIQTRDLIIELLPDGEKLSAQNLHVKFQLNGKTQEWNPDLPDTGNLRGTCRTLDLCKGNQKCYKVRTPEEYYLPVEIGPGFISRAGWSVIDDSRNVLMVQLDSGRKWVAPRPAGEHQDLYLLAYGHDYPAALHDAAEVFGSQPVPPRYALGYWYSRYWSYTDREVEEITADFRNHDIPLDVMVIDMEWHKEGWTGYTWDPRYFPDPDEFLDYLRQNGYKITLNLHPAQGVGKHEAQFPAMCQAMGLDPQTVDRVPFDITDPRYMKNYFELLHHPEEKRGVTFWWMDWQQGESTAMPGLDTLPWINHLHWEDMQNRPDKKRPLIFSRFGGVGAGRYAIGFSGDTFSSWESLSYQPEFTARAANVLYGYWSHDLGGHIGVKVNPELYMRWVQFGIFSPIVRTHTTKSAANDRRFWVFPEPFSSLMRAAIKRRYEMVPYIYSENYQTLQTGISLCHPLYYEYPELEEAYTFGQEYMFGRAMLVAPVVSPADSASNLTARDTYLPPGDWFDLVRGQKVRGNQVWHDEYLFQDIPVFVRPGAVIPGQKNCMQLNDRSYPNLVMTVYPGESGSYELYEDDGITTDYLAGKNAKILLSHQNNGQEHRFAVRKISGNFAGFLKERELELRLPGAVPPIQVLVNGVEVEFRYRLARESSPGWNYDGRHAMTVVQCGRIDLEQGGEVILRYDSEDQYAAASGLTGLFSRLDKVALLTNQILSYGGTFANERLGEDLAMTSARISRHPETFAAEISRLKKLLPGFLPALEKLVGESTARTPEERAYVLEHVKLLLHGYVD